MIGEPTESHRERADDGAGTGDVLQELGRDLDREVLALVVENSPAAVVEVARIAGYHPVTVDQTCARLHERGLVYRTSGGRYAATEVGDRQSEDRDDARA